MPEVERCSAKVPEGGAFSGFRPVQCSNKAIRTEDGKPYCTIHAPSYIKAKRERKNAERNAKWATEREQRQKQDEMISLHAKQADLFPELVEGLRNLVFLIGQLPSSGLQRETLKEAQARLALAEPLMPQKEG